ncbi:hypothetical protein H4R33_004625 [Dimargaris cristalligena]|nr:hypothetical protein H4R33_004625 [Dimargaris cristalligena]
MSLSESKDNSPPSRQPLSKVAMSIVADHRTITAASAAAVCGVVAGFPFDTIKTRMQTHNYNSLIDCARITYRDEGIRGYFRGMIPPLITVSLVKSISFSTYENIKQTVIRAPWCPIDSTHLPSYSLLCFLAGAASGGFLAFLSCPFELVKVQKQLEQLLVKTNALAGSPVLPTHAALEAQRLKHHLQQQSPKFSKSGGKAPLPSVAALGEGTKGGARSFSYTSQRTAPPSSILTGSLTDTPNERPPPTSKLPPRTSAPPAPVSNLPKEIGKSSRPATLGNTSSWQAAKDLYALRGVRGLYQGLFSHMLRDSLGTGIYFCTYETIKRLMSSPESPPGPLTFFLSGGICGVFSWLIIFPIDLVKSTIQKDALLPSHLVRYRGFLDCFTDLYRQRGIVSLYRGISVTLIRAFPIHSLNFLVYEGVLSMIRKHAPEKSA